MTENKDLISIGDLSKLSGISPLCIRAWENRYGIPEAIRLPSGHRRYPSVELLRLQLIGQATERGHRIGKLSKLTIEELQRLAESQTPPTYSISDCGLSKRHFQIIADAIRAGNDQHLFEDLQTHLENMGTIDFLDHYLTPLLHEVGQLWQDQHLSIGHEHYFSQIVLHFLQSSWRNLASIISKEPKWVLATLPGDHHDIPLHMAACTLSEHKKNILFLGARTPVEDILLWAETSAAEGICLSVSSNHCPKLAEQQVLEVSEWCREHDRDFIYGGSGNPQLDTSNKAKSFSDMGALLKPNV